MFERIFPSIKLKRQQNLLALEQTILQRRVAEQARKMFESIPSFVQDRDEDDWKKLSGEQKEIYTEADIADMQEQALKISYLPGGRNVLDTMESFIIGKNATVAALDENPDVQTYWDNWAVLNNFDMRCKEIVRRTLRDGEFFIRFFEPEGKPTMDSKKYKTIRFVEPSEIKDSSGKHSYGIECDPDDIEKPVNYYRSFTKNNSPDTETIEAKDMLHVKILVDSNVKRGISFLIGVAPYIKKYESWLEDRIYLNKIRTMFNLVGNVTGAGTIADLKSSFSDTTDKTATGGTAKKKLPKRGTVLFQRGVEWDFKNLQINAQDTKEDGRAIQLMIALGTQIPEYIVRGDASNANYSSTMVSESPFVRMVEKYQDIFEKVICKIYEVIISYAIESGQLPTHSKRTIDGKEEKCETSRECQVDFATLIHRNLKEETEAYQIHKQNRWASDRTLRSLLGYNSDDELQQIEREEKEDMEKAKARDKEYEHNH